MRLLGVIFLKIFFIICSLYCCPEGFVNIKIPKSLKIEKNIFKEKVVNNISEEGIFGCNLLYVIGEFIYTPIQNPTFSIIKLNKEGKAVGRFGRGGQGPGEIHTIFGIRSLGDNIDAYDYDNLKLVEFTSELTFVREVRFRRRFLDFIVTHKNEIVFYTDNNPLADCYFTVYSKNGDFLRKFGKKKSSQADRVKMHSFDNVRQAVAVSKKDGLWACFRNRYDLRYYENEQLKVEIKAGEDYFKMELNETAGRKWVLPIDKARNLSMWNDLLFYFYKKDGRFFCDVFDSKQFKIKKRIKLANNYIRITHYADNIFYATEFNENEDVLLYKLEFKID